MIKDERRLTIVQYAGDVREASKRLNSGGKETYGAQRYTVEYVEGLAARFKMVATITGFTSEAYDSILPSGLRVIGLGFKSGFDSGKVLAVLKATRPDLVILRSPVWRVLLWVIVTKRRTLLMLADSFDTGTMKGRLKLRILAMLLWSPVFDVVANHGRRSAEQLASAGVSAQKVLAWDYPSTSQPEQRPAKQVASAEAQVIFVGTMAAEKGVFDLIEAAGHLKSQGRTMNVQLIGTGNLAKVKAAITEKRLSQIIHVVGPVPHSEVIERMTQADIVVVPSRHEYPEGLPLTIYEAYCSRTPLIASDHPMFVGSVLPNESALVFRAGQPSELAARIAELLDDGQLYRRLSEGGLLAWRQMENPVKWAELIDLWLEDTTESRSWIASHAIGAPFGNAT